MPVLTKRSVTRKQLKKVDKLCPAATKTYQPLRHSLVADTVKRYGEAHLGPITGESFGVSEDGLRFFGVTTFKSPLNARLNARGRTDLALGYRNGYDKRLSVGIVCGSSVIVCENLCFTGDFRATRRHTKNVFDSFIEVVAEALRVATVEHIRGEAFFNLLSEARISDDMFYAMLGKCRGHGALTSSQVTSALADWRKPRFKEFEGRNAWTAYNCANQALKKTQPESMIKRHTLLNGGFVSSFPGLWDQARGVLYCLI